MGKGFFLISAAMALAAATSTGALAAGPAKLRLPPPKAPKDQVYSPGAIAQDLQKRGYRIDSMRRLGTTYSITAVGPSKSRVQMTVDGRSGEIIGLAVLQSAPNLFDAIAALVKSGKGTRYVDDWHPFGIIIPDTYQTRWTVYPATSWTTYSTPYVPEVWSGKGYRFAVPYRTVRPGAGGKSKSTLRASKMRKPAYSVRDSNGSEMTTEYSEEMTEITETTTYETTYESENETLEESYLGGEVGEDEFDVEDIVDYDSEDGDFDVADNAADGYEANVDDDDDQIDDEPGPVDDDDDDDDQIEDETGPVDDDDDDDDQIEDETGPVDDDDDDEPDDETGMDDDEPDDEGGDEDEGGDDDEGDYDEGDDDDGGDDGGDEDPDLTRATAN